MSAAESTFRPSPLTALVVDPNGPNRLRTVLTLESAGFQVASVDSFRAAREMIASAPPAVLVTALKLGEYNGFHLVLRARTAGAGIATLVTSDDPGSAFKKQALETRATLVVDPVTSRDLLAAIFRTLFRSDGTISIEPPFERRMADRRQSPWSLQFPDRRSQERRRNLAVLVNAQP